MARVPKDQSLLPSILDRLIDENLDAVGATDRVAGQALPEIKESVRRDLENLLNTRCRSVGWSDELEELDTSLVSYGIPDFMGANASSPDDLQRFLRIIEGVIRKFEPRFKSVAVKSIENKDVEERVLRFRIEGLLYAEPAPESAIYDTKMEPTTGKFDVRSHSG